MNFEKIDISAPEFTTNWKKLLNISLKQTMILNDKFDMFYKIDCGWYVYVALPIGEYPSSETLGFTTEDAAIQNIK